MKQPRNRQAEVSCGRALDFSSLRSPRELCVSELVGMQED